MRAALRALLSAIKNNNNNNNNNLARVVALSAEELGTRGLLLETSGKYRARQLTGPVNGKLYRARNSVLRSTCKLSRYLPGPIK